ncbi:hypothetical protein DTO282F9_1285 [Paecilomyces variotii]|nr:hypothetical protein DTO282F9_1285 [Paecilomyces variotii]
MTVQTPSCDSLSPPSTPGTKDALASLNPERPQAPAGNMLEKPSFRLPKWRRYVILFTVSWMTFVITFFSTAFLTAMPEIAEEFSTTSEKIAATNSGVLIAMGFSSLFWIPIGRLIGRRWAYNCAVMFLCLCSIGTALSINMAMFTAMRILSGFTGTYFMVAGQSILADIFPPLVRGTAVGFFMAGSVSGPAIAPCIGGVIVTFAHWRVIFWVQLGMAALSFVMAVFFVPDIEKINSVETSDSEKKEPPTSLLSVLYAMNPIRVFTFFVYPNIFFADFTCGLLAFFQYSLLTSVRSIFGPRFNLTTALISGLFYLAPGAGFLVGSLVGGRLSDRTVKRYIKKRNGVRIPQDRLHSGLLWVLTMLPAATLIYGWTLQEGVGGMPVPIISAFFAGWGLMGTFNGLNTYTAEVLPAHKTEVISGKYVIQYIFGASASAAVVPMINSIGAGWTFTICSAMFMLGGALTFLIAKRGLNMQEWATKKVLRK